MSLLSLLINLMQPCRIKVVINLFKATTKHLTDPKLNMLRVLCINCKNVIFIKFNIYTHFKKVFTRFKPVALWISVLIVKKNPFYFLLPLTLLTEISSSFSHYLHHKFLHPPYLMHN